MLIRMATLADVPAWLKLDRESGHLLSSADVSGREFEAYMEHRIRLLETLIAVDRMRGACLGILAFSRRQNRISWFAVHELYRDKDVGERLLSTAIAQLDPDRDITVNTFITSSPIGRQARQLYSRMGFFENGPVISPLGHPSCQLALSVENRGKSLSFHHRYDRYESLADPENCPVCQKETPPQPPIRIAELSHAFLEAYYEAQGGLFGKCHLLSKTHSEHFHEMSSSTMHGLMKNLQEAGKALHAVTGAVKINYEIHGNSLPHFHVHLFPRYLDDPFPGRPIDFRKLDASAYESEQEFRWLIEQVRKKLG